MVINEKVLAYEVNQVRINAVQGEENSRTISFEIYEKSDVEPYDSSSQSSNPMLDLTGYNATLAGTYSDNSIVSCSGTIASDPTTGVVSFTLPKAFCVYPGSLSCAIVLTKTGQELRIIGITLNVSAFSTAGIASSTKPQPLGFYRGTSYPIYLTAVDESNNPFSLTNTQAFVFKVKNADGQTVINKVVSSNDGTAGEFLFSISGSDTISLDPGDYTYTIQFADSSGSTTYYLPVVVPSTLTLYTEF